MRKRVLLIAGNYWPEPTGIGKYNGEMIDWLSAKGFECRVITTYPYYPYWKVQEPYRKRKWWFSSDQQKTPDGKGIKITRCPHYVPKRPTGLKRMISDVSFSMSCALVILKLLFYKRYDYIITVAPPFQTGLLAILYKKLRRAKFLYHIQDLQIDAAAELGMIRSASLINLLFKTEKFILKHADTISTISAGMVSRVRAKCNKEVLEFPNWADTNFFYPVEDKALAKVKFGFKPSQKTVLYSGAIGEKQGLEAIVYVAKELQEFQNVVFVICGSGPYKEKLQQLQQSLKVPNVVFMPTQPKETFNLFLNAADIHLVLQKSNAGDLVMPSKVTSILAVGGLSIITANPGTALYNVFCKKDMGLVAEPENIRSMSATIRYAVENDLEEMRHNARKYAEEYLSIDKILTRYASEVFEYDTAALRILSNKVVM